MRRFTAEEVKDILSQNHLTNTANALNKREDEVTADDLILHWVRFHEIKPIKFIVDGEEELFV